MPVLPVGPPGLSMPPQPQNPPTLMDIRKAIDYFVNVEVGFRMPFFFPIFLNH